MLFPNKITLSGNLKKKEWSNNTCYNTDKPWKYKVKETLLKSAHIIWFHLNEMSGIGKSIDTGSRLVVSRSWGRREMGVTLKGYRIFFLAEKMF